MNHAQLICHLKLAFCTVTMSFPQIIIGGSFIFSNTILEQLRTPSSTIKLNIDEESWITSISLLACPIGLFVTGILTDKYGKRRCLQIIYLPLILSWITFILADSFKMLMIGRILIGIPTGAVTCTTLYIAEACPVNLRSLHLSLIAIFSSTGMILECIMAIYYPWKTIPFVMCVMCIVNFLTLFTVPEPSVWLRAKGKTVEADKVDEWFDLGHISDANAAGSSADLQTTSDTKGKPYWKSFIHPTVWKPTLILVMFYICQQGTGLYVLLLYTTDVLRDFKISWNSNTVSMFLSVARLLGSISFGILHWCKKRTLVSVSGGFMAASLIVVVAHSKIYKNVDDPPYTVVSLLAFIVYMFFALLGVLTMPWVLSGELYPIATKGVMNGVLSSVGYILCFAICKIYPSMVIHFGVDNVWSIFAVSCLSIIVFAICIMPETKGKSLEEISSRFESHKDIRNNNAP